LPTRPPALIRGPSAKPKSKHLASTQEAPEVKPVRERKTPAKKAAAEDKPKKAPAKKAAAPAGKVVKVAPTKSEAAAVKALKELPPKKAAPKKAAAKAPADAVPVKKVIKRVKKTEE